MSHRGEKKCFFDLVLNSLKSFVGCIIIKNEMSQSATFGKLPNVGLRF